MRHKIYALLFTAISLGYFAESAVAETTTTLRYAHPNAPTSIPGQFATMFADLVAEKTGGEVKVEVFPASQLGGVREMIEGAQLGSIDLGHNDFAALAQLLPDLAVFNLPYLYRNEEHALAATNPAKSEVAEELSNKLKNAANLRIMGSFFYGVRALTTSNFVVKTPKDLAGKKIRAIPVPIWISMVKGMGAIPTPVDFSELPTALATGVVDGQENPPVTIQAAGLYERQKYLMLTNHMTATLAVYMNNGKFTKLSAENQQAVQDAVVDAAAAIKKIALNRQKAVLADLKSKGMTVVTEADGLDVDAFRTAVGKQVGLDFPKWQGYIDKIIAIK